MPKLPVKKLDSPAAIERAWEEHRKEILPLSTWHLSGKAGMVTKKNSGMANMKWAQHDARYSFVLTGTLGQMIAHLQGGKDYAMLSVPGKRIMNSTNAESMLLSVTGWKIPVSRLFYWIRGVPAPEGLSGMMLDNQGYLAKLSQSGWDVSFRDYVMVSQRYILPSRIQLKGENVSIKLVLDWTDAGQTKSSG